MSHMKHKEKRRCRLLGQLNNNTSQKRIQSELAALVMTLLTRDDVKESSFIDSSFMRVCISLLSASSAVERSASVADCCCNWLNSWSTGPRS